MKNICRKSISVDYKEKEAGCTFAKVKSCIKIFCAHLFSHVGLTALVVSLRKLRFRQIGSPEMSSGWLQYLWCLHILASRGLNRTLVLGSLHIFYIYKGENEILTRVKVGNNRKDVLDQLYNITGETVNVLFRFIISLSLSLYIKRCRNLHGMFDLLLPAIHDIFSVFSQ